MIANEGCLGVGQMAGANEGCLGVGQMAGANEGCLGVGQMAGAILDVVSSLMSVSPAVLAAAQQEDQACSRYTFHFT